jgi:uncharacterized cupin superfamily protein
MPRVSISDPTFTYDSDDPERFRCGLFRPGPDLGAAETGASVYELPPGRSVCPYHYEHAEEEWALVLQGTATVRTPEGAEQAGPNEIFFFPKGPAGAHQITNDTAEPVRVLMFSNVVYPAVTVYPDSEKVGVFLRDRSENLMARRSSNVDYFDGEV